MTLRCLAVTTALGSLAIVLYLWRLAPYGISNWHIISSGGNHPSPSWFPVLSPTDYLGRPAQLALLASCPRRLLVFVWFLGSHLVLITPCPLCFPCGSYIISFVRFPPSDMSASLWGGKA